MDTMIGQEAKAYLESLPRIHRYEEHTDYPGVVYLLPEEIDYEVNEDSTIAAPALSEGSVRKSGDLIRVIVPEDPLKMRYETTNVLTPLMYAESLEDILWHMTTQAIVYTRLTPPLREWIVRSQRRLRYGRHSMDSLWLPCSRPLRDVRDGEYICVHSRRVGGWDGSPERPVIDLLGTGGHLPCVWDPEKKTFRVLSFHENLRKEAMEELGLSVDPESIHLFGGYKNEVTHELVVLAGIEITPRSVPEIETYAVRNTDPDSMGLYLGTFQEVMAFYRRNPEYFAGGKLAAPTNFPFQPELMRVVEGYFANRGIFTNADA